MAPPSSEFPVETSFAICKDRSAYLTSGLHGTAGYSALLQRDILKCQGKAPVLAPENWASRNPFFTSEGLFALPTSWGD